MKTSGLTRVDLGRSTPTGIVPVPTASVIVKPAIRISTIPRNVIPVPQSAQQNQTRTSSPAPSQNASLGGTSNSSQAANAGRNSLSLEQIKTGRKQVMDEIASLEEQHAGLLKDLTKEYTDDPTWIPFIAAKLQETEQSKLLLFGRLQELNNLETANLSNKIQELNSKLESRSASNTPTYISTSRDSIHFGYSAFPGIGAMIWFTLSMGIQQWEFTTLLMMVGTGIGIAFAGWITGRGW
ncbi:MAG: hypothetical protein IPL71_13720 [Anaerolineales bacterium]|uniref:hypothetical protein n=1 Tax=Candidatus Villigracilis proximus TaxID=3140683 RepID=UPI0031368EE1|nr:hypothetical protein [Anaerolineales bacterium]